MTPQELRALAKRADDCGSLEANGMLDELAAALRDAADRLDAVQSVVDEYGGWYEDSPEDSWRFERDIRSVLGMAQYDQEASE